MAGMLEQALVQLEAQTEAALKSAQTVQTALRKTKAAAKTGNLRDIDRALATVLATGTEFAKRLEASRESWQFEAESYFSDGRFAAELIAAAAAGGLRLFENNGRIYCYPMLLTVAAKDLALLINRKSERRVRPSALVKLLSARQKQPQKFAVAQFLETLFSVYRLLAPHYDRGWTPESSGQGPVVPLVEMHEALTLLPGAERDYPLVEFTRDVHLLDRQPDTRTNDGRRFSLPAATGTKSGKRLTMVDEHGGEHIYVGFALSQE
jgi:hypothetical protein